MDKVTRIDLCSQSLKSLASKNFGDIWKKIKKTEKKLSKAQSCVLDACMVRNYKVLAGELNSLHHLEESYWFMRAWSNEF